MSALNDIKSNSTLVIVGDRGGQIVLIDKSTNAEDVTC